MRIAFYAPMKSPSHPISSGDRHMARLMIRALEMGGHEVYLASELRAWEGKGDAAVQMEIRRQAQDEIERLIQQYSVNPPDCWFSYHVYHKSPDWIGPEVATAIEIPYLIAETSYAPKQANGPWKHGLKQTELAICQAAAIVSLNPTDNECVQALLPRGKSMLTLKPFLDMQSVQQKSITNKDRHFYVQRYAIPEDSAWLIAVAMMRPGDKTKSYRLLTQAMTSLLNDDWQLLLVGDGKSRTEIEHAFASLPSQRVHFIGHLDNVEVYPLLCACDLFVWPAINEAYGMALLEAQACGLPVVAGNSGGVGNIIVDGITGILTKPGVVKPFAEAVHRLISQPDRLTSMSRAARQSVQSKHDISSAAWQLDQLLKKINQGISI